VLFFQSIHKGRARFGAPMAGHRTECLVVAESAVRQIDPRPSNDSPFLPSCPDVQPVGGVSNNHDLARPQAMDPSRFSTLPGRLERAAGSSCGSARNMFARLESRGAAAPYVVHRRGSFRRREHGDIVFTVDTPGHTAVSSRKARQSGFRSVIRDPPIHHRSGCRQKQSRRQSPNRTDGMNYAISSARPFLSDNVWRGGGATGRDMMFRFYAFAMRHSRSIQATRLR